MKNELTAGKKTSAIPLITPGIESGRVTFQKCLIASLRLSHELASNNDLSILDKDVLICKIIKGIKL